MHNIVSIPILYGLIDDIFDILMFYYEYDYIYYILAFDKVPRQGNVIAMVCFLHHLMSSFYISKLLKYLDVMQKIIYITLHKMLAGACMSTKKYFLE